jgi:hypothetical protein
MLALIFSNLSIKASTVLLFLKARSLPLKFDIPAVLGYGVKTSVELKG